MKRLLGSLLWLLCTQVCCVTGVQVEQSPPALILQEGASSTLWCNFSSTAQNIQWFRQDPGGRLVNLFYIPSGTKQNGRLEATTVPKERHSSLLISSSQPTDSATYFCAMAGTGTVGYQLTFGKGTKLSVTPIINKTEPAVYRLKDPKSRDISVCLFTDFGSDRNVSELMGPEMSNTEKTVLDMKSLDSKSNGAVAWSNKTNFECSDAFPDDEFYPSSDFPCNATLVEESFETDMNLNLQNLTVMGLRIFLLKVAGFNLLMTLRLWSS